MLYHFLIAVALIFFLMGAWIFVQALERRQSKMEKSEDCDVLFRRIGCIGCALQGRCKKLGNETK